MRMVQPSVATGHDQMIDIAIEREKARAALGCRLGQLLDQCGVWGELTDQGQQRYGPGQLSAVMRRTQRYQGVYVAVASQTLHVITGDQAAKAVSDDVDPFIASGRRQFLDGLTQMDGGLRNVMGEQAVVVRGQRLEAAAPERVLHPGKGGVVVDDAVHQHYRRLRSVYAVVKKAALFRAKATQIMSAAPCDSSGLGHKPQRIHQHVRGCPGGLDGESGRHARHIECHETREARGANACIGTGPHDKILLGSRLNSWIRMCGQTRLHFELSSLSRDLTATIAAPKWSLEHCVTLVWRSSTPDSIKRRSRLWLPPWPRMRTPLACLCFQGRT